MTLTFVVGSGRCGSTMLSEILHKHPEVLSLSEFVNVLRWSQNTEPPYSNEIPGGKLDGKELWDMLSAPRSVVAAWAHTTTQPEKKPPFYRMVLSRLTDDPDTLYARLARAVPAWPRRPAAEQYRTLFDFLAGLLGRRVVVERSGGTAGSVRMLHQQFPDARFVHLHRDGPDCAYSMSRFPPARLAILTGQAALAAGLPMSATRQKIQQRWSRVPSELRDLLAFPIDKERLMTADIPLAPFGDRWADIVCHATTDLIELPAGSWIAVRYEDLLHSPGPELTRLAEFIGVTPTAEWTSAAAGIIDPTRSGRAAQLDVLTLEALHKACLPGTLAISAAEEHLHQPGSG
jgi:sulfotransferase family protein